MKLRSWNRVRPPISKVTFSNSISRLVFRSVAEKSMPAPSPFARGATPTIPRNVPPAFIACAGSGDQQHAVWADEYFAAMLAVSAPNIEMHIYGNGHHPGSGSKGRVSDRKRQAFGN